MDSTKLAFVFVLLVHVLLNQECRSYPIFEYIFGGDASAENGDAAAKTAHVNPEPNPAQPPVSANNAPGGGSLAGAVVPAGGSRPVAAVPADGSAVAPKAAPAVCVQRLGNIGAPLAANTVGLVANTLGKGVKGLKNVVDGGSDLTVLALMGAGYVKDAAIDGLQDAIDKGAVKTLNRVASWAETMDGYRRALSGSSKKNADKAHSITITTSSNAPVDSLNKFWNKYSPGQGGGGSSTADLLPEITSIDFSQWW